MNALVTGAGGFVGRWLLDALARRGVEAVGAGHGADRSVDFRMPDDVAALVDQVRPSVVYHLAGTSTLEELLRDPQGGNYNVVQPAVSVLEALATHAPGARLVLVSPCEVYGRAPRLPIDERCPLTPTDLYAAARAAVEYMSRAYAGRGVNVVIARAFHFTGPGQDRRSPLGDAAVRGARKEPVRVGNPALRRDYMDVRDLVEGLLLLGERGTPGEAYNLCSGQARAMGDWLRAAAGEGAEIVEDPELVRATDAPVYLGSPAKAEALGWRRTHDIDTTLAELRASARGQEVRSPESGVRR